MKQLLNISICIFLLNITTVFGQTDIVKTLYFQPNNYTTDSLHNAIIDGIIGELKSEKFSYLKIIGYADTTGNESYNEILSEKRANAVYKLISSKTKLNKDKLYVTWIGESGKEVAYDLHFEKAHIQKRCVDIWIIKKK